MNELNILENLRKLNYYLFNFKLNYLFIEQQNEVS
jgi:hypothetical protein